MTRAAHVDGAVAVQGWAEGIRTAYAAAGVGGVHYYGEAKAACPAPVALEGDWACRLYSTMDNRWGDFALPGSLMVDCRRFRYRQEAEGEDGLALGWHRADFDDSRWQEATYSVRPHCPVSAPQPATGEAPPKEAWSEYWFSTCFGIEDDPVIGRWLGPEGHVLPEFNDLGEAPAGTVRYVKTWLVSDADQAVQLHLGAPSPKTVWLNGGEVARQTEALYTLGVPVRLKKGHNEFVVRLQHPQGGALRVCFFCTRRAEAAAPRPPPPRPGSGTRSWPRTWASGSPARPSTWRPSPRRRRCGSPPTTATSSSSTAWPSPPTRGWAPRCGAAPRSTTCGGSCGWGATSWPCAPRTSAGRPALWPSPGSTTSRWSPTPPGAPPSPPAASGRSPTSTTRPGSLRRPSSSLAAASGAPSPTCPVARASAPPCPTPSGWRRSPGPTSSWWSAMTGPPSARSAWAGTACGCRPGRSGCVSTYAASPRCSWTAGSCRWETGKPRLPTARARGRVRGTAEVALNGRRAGIRIVAVKVLGTE